MKRLFLFAAILALGCTKDDVPATDCICTLFPKLPASELEPQEATCVQVYKGAFNSEQYYAVCPE